MRVAEPEPRLTSSLPDPVAVKSRVALDPTPLTVAEPASVIVSVPDPRLMVWDPAVRERVSAPPTRLAVKEMPLLTEFGAVVEVHRLGGAAGRPDGDAAAVHVDRVVRGPAVGVVAPARQIDHRGRVADDDRPAAADRVDGVVAIVAYDQIRSAVGGHVGGRRSDQHGPFRAARHRERSTGRDVIDHVVAGGDGVRGVRQDRGGQGGVDDRGQGGVHIGQRRDRGIYGEARRGRFPPAAIVVATMSKSSSPRR